MLLHYKFVHNLQAKTSFDIFLLQENATHGAADCVIMVDELGSAERVYALAGEPFTDEARLAIAGYLSGHRRGRLGNVETSCDMFGLREDNLRARFAPYVERFLT